MFHTYYSNADSSWYLENKCKFKLNFESESLHLNQSFCWPTDYRLCIQAKMNLKSFNISHQDSILTDARRTVRQIACELFSSRTRFDKIGNGKIISHILRPSRHCENAMYMQ